MHHGFELKIYTELPRLTQHVTMTWDIWKSKFIVIWLGLWYIAEYRLFSNCE